jgi:hypothetical protein
MKDRTTRKLRFAEIHISELRDYIHATSNDDWENAHQESSFYHLAGAVEAILHEINDAYMLGLTLDKVKWEKVARALSRDQKASPAFIHLETLRTDVNSWLSQLFEWRNHGTHRRHVNKIVHVSTHEIVDNEFLDPRTGENQIVYPSLRCQAVLERLALDVKELIKFCRAKDSLLSVENDHGG